MYIPMPTYNVVLSTQYTATQPFGNLLRPIGNGNLANVTWLVNWDGLFGADALRYKKCVLRYRLVSETSASITAPNNTGFLSLTGVSTDKQAGNIPSAFIGLITPEVSPTSGQNRFNISTLGDFHGTQINVPSGTNELAVRFYNDDAITFQSNLTNYIINLQFSLYNEERE